MTKYLDLLGLTTYDLAIKLYIDNSTPESITTEEIEELFNNGDIPGGHEVGPSEDLPAVVQTATINDGSSSTPWPTTFPDHIVWGNSVTITAAGSNLRTSNIELKKVASTGSWDDAVVLSGTIAPNFATWVFNAEDATKYGIFVNGEQYGSYLEGES